MFLHYYFLNSHKHAAITIVPLGFYNDVDVFLMAVLYLQIAILCRI